MYLKSSSFEKTEEQEGNSPGLKEKTGIVAVVLQPTGESPILSTYNSQRTEDFIVEILSYWWAFLIIIIALITGWKIRDCLTEGGHDFGLSPLFALFVVVVGLCLILGVLAIKGCIGWH